MTISIKRNDLLPTVDVALEAPSGTPVDLTGVTVKFIMTLQGASSPKVNAAATVVSPTAGTVTYAWVGTDTDTAGTYVAEFEVTFASGKKRTFPERGYLFIEVETDLA